jgi:hypothetical protein
LARKDQVLPRNCFQAVSERAYRKNVETEPIDGGCGTTAPGT